ncbi:MAG: thioredoxin family protein [Saprospiraceae bacterium]
MKTQKAIIRNLILLIVCFQSLVAQANNSPALNLESARQSATKENKLLMLKFGASWCLPCKFMDKTVFSDQELVHYMNDRVVLLQVDIDQISGRDLAEQYQIKTIPTIIFIHPNGNVIARKENSLGLTDFKSWLESLVVENKITIAAPTAQASNRIIVEQNEEDFFEAFEKNKTTNLPPEKEDSVHTVSASHSNTTENNSKEEEINKTSYQAKNQVFFGQYYVQLGAFSVLDNALTKANDLDEKFSQNASILEAEDQSGNKLYKINLGPFDTEEEAQLFVEVLKDRNMNALVKKAEL